MADTVLTQTQLENIFQSLTSTILNTTDPSAVRISWPTDGAPSWKITDNVCFLKITPNDDPYTRPVQTDYGQQDADNAYVNQVSTDGVRVSWNFYGPNSWDNARLVRSQLFTDATTTTLQSNNLALVTDVSQPVRMPELYNGQWWDRALFYANFNELVIRQSSVPYIQNVTLTTKEG